MTSATNPDRTAEGPRIAISVDEAELLLGCLRETEEAIEEVEYELLFGVPHDVLRALRERIGDRIRAASRVPWSPPDDAGAIVPYDRWLAIVTYRGFHDVPRLILATDYESRFWVLDCPFDDGLDNYVADYTVHYAGRDLGRAHEALERFGTGADHGLGAAIAHHPVGHVNFDEKLRYRLKLVVRRLAGE